MPSQPAPFDAEEFWDDLLAFIEDGRVIPVVGSELLTIEENGKVLPLYRVVAERLLEKYKTAVSALPGPIVLRDHHELNDAVAALVAARKPVKDLYRPINEILQRLLDSRPEPLPALRELAAIRQFDLFAVTTPDDLLARAIDAERFGGAALTDRIEYAPSLPTERRRDIPELRSSGYTAVFQMFGRADVSPVYAIHDEDTLEFAYTLQYTLQNGVPPARMFSELRSRNLLLLGCNFADWLSRLFLRLSNEKRLSSSERPKKEFLVGPATDLDENLTVFLERFSRDSRCYASGTREFVAELFQRWSDRNPAATPGLPGAALVNRSATAGGNAIFISYATEDVASAKRISDELQEIGDVIWLDKRALKPGDDWHRQIIGAVQRCDLFVPLLSAATEQRTEGYFRLEWSEAAERSRRIQGRKFIFPVVVDVAFSGMSGYSLVPDAFRTFQFSHAPGGQISTELIEEITSHVRNAQRRGNA